MSFDQNERALLAELADVLIPAASGMPSASQADVAGQWLDAVLAARPDLAGRLKDLLATARDGHANVDANEKNPQDVVTDLRANDPAASGVLAEIVPAAYFMNPDVQQAVGYSGQKAQPMDPRPDYMEDGLLESVIRRGPIYRPTPDF